MIELPRLTILRQRRLLQALAEAQNDKAFVKTLAPPARSALAAAIEAGAALDGGHVLPPLLVDHSADAAFGAFEGLLGNIVRGMNDAVIAPLPPVQARKRAAAALLQQRLFSDGVEFLSRPMDLQYRAMATVVDVLRKDAACKAAVKELDVGYFVDHMEAHLAPYGRVVQTKDGVDLEAAGGAFHDAYTKLVVQIAANHAGDEEIEKRLHSPYKSALEAQREEERRHRARSRKKKALAAKADAAKGQATKG